jgi:hypothetical protein
MNDEQLGQIYHTARNAVKQNDGGQAFPIPAGDYNGTKCGNKAYSGMTLRDYFASKALEGMLAHPGDESRGSYHNNSTPEEAAQRAYEYADAMIRARGA